MVDQRLNRYVSTLFDRIVGESDIAEHLLTLYAFATLADVIVEFGVRSGNSTLAFLAGQSLNPRPKRLFSFDIQDCAGTFRKIPLTPGDEWVFTRADTSKLRAIPACEILFIDTLHTADQVRAELRHAPQVERFIILHDTELFGTDGERGEAGIRAPMMQFLTDNPSWGLFKHFTHNNGLTVLERQS